MFEELLIGSLSAKAIGILDKDNEEESEEDDF